MNPLDIMRARKQAHQMQDSLKTVLATGESKKGLVKVTLNGANELVDIHINEIMMEDRVELQKHIKDAHRDALKRLSSEMRKNIDPSQAMEMLKGLMK